MKEQLYYNGTIITMKQEGERKEAIWIKDGKIAGVGDIEELSVKASNAEKIDLKGKIMLPAFLDAHSHLVQWASALQFVRLDQVKNFKELIQVLKEALNKKKQKETWLIGFGYEHNRMEERQHPDKQVLNQISMDTPILITHASGHMGCVNSAALKVAQITEHTSDPAGGRIGRVLKTMEPNGYLEENAFQNIMPWIVPEKVDQMECLKNVQEQYFRYGITTAQEGYAKEKELLLLSKAAEKNLLKIDVVAYADIKTCYGKLKEFNSYQKRYQNHFKIGGYKMFLDGSPQGRTAWLTSPYVKEKGQNETYCGYPIYEDQEVEKFVEQAEEEQMQLLTHCNGDAAVWQLLNSFKRPTQNRDVIIHAQIMKQEQMPFLKKFLLMPSFFVAHTYYWGDTHIRNLGRERANVISPVAWAIEEGIPYTFHQDTPVIMPNMLETVWCAVNRKTEQGEVLGEAEHMKVSVWEALKGVTVNAAYQYFEEKEKGTLEEGKRADFILLDQDPLKMDPEKIREIKILATYKDGDLVYSLE